MIALEPGVEAVGLTHEQGWRLDELVRRLAAARYVPAEATLASLWRNYAPSPVRFSAGHALLAIGTPSALATVGASLDDGNYFCRSLAARAMFALLGERAFDVLSPRFADAGDKQDEACLSILQFLAPQGYRRSGPMRDDGAAAALADGRWLHLCAEHCRDAFLGNCAREILRHAPADQCVLALSTAHIRRMRQVAPRVHRDGRLLSRYNSGDHEAVWRDIRAVPSIGDEFRLEVQEVAEVAMRRVAANADKVAERLRAWGWIALTPESSDLRTLPRVGDEAVFREMAELTEAPVPPTLLAFWRIVGGVNWVWDYRQPGARPDLGVDLNMDQMDPLYVDPPSVVARLFEGWREQKDQLHPALVDPFEVDLSPDYLHKADISGGAPYSIVLPFLGADPTLKFERHDLPFLEYLRLCFRWAGFPGLEDHGDREDVRRFVKAFATDLEPF